MSSTVRFLVLGVAVAAIILTLALVGCSRDTKNISAFSSGEADSSLALDSDTPIQQVDKLVRIPKRGWLGGVLAGFAYWLQIPLWALRLGVVAVVLFFGGTIRFGNVYISTSSGSLIIIGYILLWIFMSSIDFVPADFNAVTS